MSTEEGIKINIESADDEKDAESPERNDGQEEVEKVKADTATDKAEDASNAAEGEEENSDTADDAKEKSGEEGRRKHAGRKNKKDPRDEKIEQLEDRVKRQMAEFENFRKRTDKEKALMFDMGAKSVIEKILPVIDNFERGLENVPEGCDEAFADGMQKIYRQLTDELDRIGVKPIEAVGQPFDPNIHNAVMQVDTEEYESGMVAQELQKGYMYHETLVRPSMVGVAQ